MKSTAAFKIRTNPDGAWSPFADGGFDAEAGSAVDVQLEASPALDVRLCRYSITTRSKGAPAPTLTNDGVASPPTGIVTIALPAGVHSFEITAQTNGGGAVRGSDNRPDWSVNTKKRIVSVRSWNGQRKILLGESLEYSPTGGWVDAQNEMVDAIASMAAQLGQGIALLPTPFQTAAPASVPAAAAYRWLDLVALKAAGATSLVLNVLLATSDPAQAAHVDLVDLAGATRGGEPGVVTSSHLTTTSRAATIVAADLRAMLTSPEGDGHFLLRAWNAGGAETTVLAATLLVG